MGIASKTIVVAILLLLSTLLHGCASTSAKREEAHLRLRIGTALLSQGKFPEALQELTEARRLDPKNELILNNLALAYYVREKYREADAIILEALELNPKYSEARNNRARVLIELGRFDEAERESRRVIEDLTYTEPGKAWVNLGYSQFRRGDYPAARISLAKAIEYDRTSCLGMTIYGRTLLELNTLEEAVRSLDSATILCKSEGNEDALYFSGLAHYRVGQMSAAVSRMEELLKKYTNGLYAKKAESMLEIMR